VAAREVEDLPAVHLPAVREVAVIGVPDHYRGETVKAFVSLRAGATVTPEELVRGPGGAAVVMHGGQAKGRPPYSPTWAPPARH
jgi:hypothetical protein